MIKKYRSINSLQKDIRKFGTEDTLFFKGIIFTMTNYDMSGEMIIYENKEHNLTIDVKTENRYGWKKFSDAIVEFYVSNIYNI